VNKLDQARREVFASETDTELVGARKDWKTIFPTKKTNP